jgi:hypothetical protein
MASIGRMEREEKGGTNIFVVKSFGVPPDPLMDLGHRNGPLLVTAGRVLMATAEEPLATAATAKEALILNAEQRLMATAE